MQKTETTRKQVGNILSHCSTFGAVPVLGFRLTRYTGTRKMELGKTAVASDRTAVIAYKTNEITLA